VTHCWQPRSARVSTRSTSWRAASAVSYGATAVTYKATSRSIAYPTWLYSTQFSQRHRHNEIHASPSTAGEQIVADANAFRARSRYECGLSQARVNQY
jgi:hypothetical protein